MAVIEHRVRRPADKADFIERLANGPEKVFPSMRDLFVFAAVLGKSAGSAVPFTATEGDPIRLELFYKDPDHVLLFETLAVLENPDDVEILRDDRLGEVVAIFERYVNGGLEILQAELAANRLVRADEVLMVLAMRELEREQAAQSVDLARFADELGL